jgi:two-component system cell cycle sensor histidine kinase/response regulator CckA
LDLALKGANSGLWDWNIKTGEVLFDEIWCGMIGYRKEELDPNVRTWENLLHPDDKEKVMDVLNRHFESEKNEYKVEARLQCKNGSWKWILAGGKVFERDKAGKPLRMVGTHIDITESKKVEQDLSDRELQLKGITNSVPGAIFQFYARSNGEFGLYHSSRQTKTIFGIDVENLEIEQVFPIFVEGVSPDCKEEFIASVQKAVKEFSKWEYEGRFIKTSGEEIYFSGVAEPIRQGDEILFNGVLLDITERKKVGDLFNESRDYLENIINTIGDPVFVKNEQYQFVVVNESFCKVLGKTREELIGATGGEFLPESEMEHFLKVDRDILSAGEDNTCEEKLTAFDGQVRDIITRKTRHINSSGEKFIIGVIHDITERKKVEGETKKHTHDLEVFYKASSGREERILELKKEIQALRQRLTEYEKKHE